MALATISFQDEAYDSAVQFFACLTANGPRVGGWRDESGQGYTVEVFPTHGLSFTAEVVSVMGGRNPTVTVAEWDDEAGRGDRSRLRTFNLYDELERIEVV